MGMVGMPMPNTMHTSMVRMSEARRLFSPSCRICPAKLVAEPVSVSIPTTMPTMAHAKPTGTACFAPSIKELRKICKVLLPPLMKKQATTRRAINPSTGTMPNSRKEAAPNPSATQKT